jgi:hypothetical protein
MGRMRALLSVALGLAGALVQAEAAAQTAGVSAVFRPTAVTERQVEKPSKAAEPLRKQVATLAVLYTDDADATRLPAFATRTTPLPTRLLRIGVEWSF